jgi:hypothetical protein
MVERLDPIKLGKYYKANQTAFFLDIKKWHSFRTRYKFDWDVVPFQPDKRDDVPEVPGLYAFVVSSDHPKLPPHAYVLYVGQSGHGTSKHNLKKRFGDYLRDQKNGTGRYAVCRMLVEFKDDLKFYFAAMPNAKLELEDVETKLLSAIIPPVNQNDFEADIKVARKAAF